MTEDEGEAEKKTRGCANLATAVSVIIWSILFFRAASHYREVATFGYPDATGAWDFWVYLPLGIALGLFLSALVFNFALRSASALTLLCGLALIALMAVLPYLIMTSGGV